MKENFEFVSKHITIFSVATSGIGLLYMSLYYYVFDVPIIYYLSVNDMLLFSVTLIVPVFVIVLFMDYIINGIQKYLYKNKLDNSSDKAYKLTCMLIIYIVMMFLPYITIIRNNPNLRFFILFSSFTMIAYIASTIKPANVFITITIVTFGFVSSILSLTKITKEGFSNKELKFIYNGEVISTSYHNDLNYIGETSSTIILYNFQKKISYLFEKENITGLTYMNKIDKQFSKSDKLKFYALKKAKFTTSSDTIFKPYVWYTNNKISYWWSADKNAIGLSKLMWELEYILNENKLDFETPSHAHSSLPIKISIKDDFKTTSDAINTGDYEVHKQWHIKEGEIHLELNKDWYIIWVIYDKKNK